MKAPQRDPRWTKVGERKPSKQKVREELRERGKALSELRGLKIVKPVPDAPCERCGGKLITVAWTRLKNSLLLEEGASQRQYLFVCDNYKCALYRQPVKMVVGPDFALKE